MKPLWRGIAIGASAYLAFLVATVPAQKVVSWMQPQLQGVRLDGVQGGLWSGRASLVDVSGVQLQNVQWLFRPIALFIGKVEFSVDARVQEQTVHAIAGSRLWGNPYLREVQGRVPASDVLYWLSLNQVQVEGGLTLDLERVQWSDAKVPMVDGVATWSGAGVVAPFTLSLGNARLETRGEDGVTRGRLKSEGGDLLVQAEVSLKTDGAYTLDAGIQQAGPVPQAVSKFLETFTEYKDGTYRLEWADSIIK